ncbi:MAG: RidA family protein [Solirubrobacterales bacterium]
MTTRGAKRAIAAEAGPPPGGPYSPAIAVGDLLFVSGQRPVDRSGAVVAGGFEEQARQVFANLRSVLDGAGAALSDVVKVTVHLASISSFDELNLVYREFFEEPFPTRTTVGSQLRGILVEVDAIAVRGSGTPGEEGAS